MVDPVPVVTDVPAERIRTSLATYRRLFGEAGWQAARSYAPAIEEVLGAVAPHWVDELSRWAEVAEADLEDLLVLNARSEVLSVVQGQRRRGECTVVAEPGRLGQTWDWFARQRPAMIVLRTGRLLTLTEAGMLAKIGLNDHGLAVGLTYLASSSDRVPGEGSLPLHAVLRLLLERAASVDGALALLEGLSTAGSACIALADATGATLVEVTPHGRAVLPAGVHTNHCLAHDLVGLQGPVDFLADSESRLARAVALRDAGVPVERLLADTAGGYSAVDQPPDPALAPHDRTETVLAVVIEPPLRRLRIAPGRPSQTGFTQLVEL